MLSVLDAPEHSEDVETHTLTAHELTIEQAQPRRARPGFWRTLAHGITTHRIHRPRARHVPACSASRPFEAPMDRLVREHPSLAPLVLSIV